MTMAQESSVVFSVRQLLDEEQARQEAELAEREALLAREAEERQIALAAEAARAEQVARRAREDALRLDAIREGELLRARLTADAAGELARQQVEAECASRAATHALTVQAAQKQTRSRMLVAALITLLVGGIAIGALVIVPGQRRADQAYARLQEQHASFAEQATQRESSLTRRVQALGEELKRAQLELAAAAVASAQNVIGVPIKRRPIASQPAVPKTRTPVCTCLASDPLCDCER